uniref:Uncharacterized protein n=1 Tax=Sus scrofa TaxID=9823 RepID=A0A8D1NUK0_PIG
MSTSNSETPTPDPSLSVVSERRDLGQGAALQPQPGTPEIERRLRGGNGNPEEGVLGTFLVDPNTYDLLTREGSTGRTHPDGDALSLREALGGPQASRAEDSAPPTAGLRAQRRGFLRLGQKTLEGTPWWKCRHSPGSFFLASLLRLLGGMSLTHTTGLLLLTLLLLLKPGETLRYAHSLCLDFAVTSQSRPGQPWCEVQGSMDTKPLLQYDSDSNQVTASGPLGKKVLPGCRPSCAVSLKQSESPLPPGTSASMGRRPSSLTPWT